MEFREVWLRAHEKVSGESFVCLHSFPRIRRRTSCFCGSRESNRIRDRSGCSGEQTKSGNETAPAHDRAYLGKLAAIETLGKIQSVCTRHDPLGYPCVDCF